MTCGHVHTHAKYRVDPTRTLTLRRRYERDMDRRFRELRQLIARALIEQDVFGLVGTPNVQALPGKKAFNYRRTSDKVDAFMRWLKQEQKKGVLEVKRGASQFSNANSWQDLYLETAYQKGIQRSATRLRGEGVIVEDTWVETAFLRPTHADRAGLVFTRAFSDLEGITEVMDRQISRTLARGLAEGKHPRKIAKELLGRVDSIGRVRAKALARTEIIGAHAEATLNSFEEAGVQDVEAEVEFATAQDNAVCPQCEALEGQIYKLSEARGIIPVHPNCRCAWLPVVRDIRGRILR